MKTFYDKSICSSARKTIGVGSGILREPASFAAFVTSAIGNGFSWTGVAARCGGQVQIRNAGACAIAIVRTNYLSTVRTSNAVIVMHRTAKVAASSAGVVAFASREGI